MLGKYTFAFHERNAFRGLPENWLGKPRNLVYPTKQLLVQQSYVEYRLSRDIYIFKKACATKHCGKSTLHVDIIFLGRDENKYFSYVLQ